MLFQEKKILFNFSREDFYSGIYDIEIKYLGIVYVNYCCIFMAKKKSVGDN